LSLYKTVDLTAYKTVAVENVRFMHAELENLEQSCIQASDVLNCFSTGISSALYDRIPHKNTPVLIETAGAFGVRAAARQLPAIPYAGITMAGICWGISGNLAWVKAQEASAEAKIETERMACVLGGLKAVENRIAEGEGLLFALSKKLKESLDALQSLAGNGNELSEEAAKKLDASVQLVQSIKQVIETDVCNADCFLIKKSGVVFRKIEKEIRDV